MTASERASSDDQSPDSYRPGRDPAALRALAHPVRLRILDELVDSGPATATELAERVDESPANCSWHLRQLARYAFIEPAGGGKGRQRPWQVVPRNLSFSESGSPGSDLARAENAAIEVFMAREIDVLTEWRSARHADGAPWDSAGFERQNRLWLTAEEVNALSAAMQELIEQCQDRHAERIDPAERPPGCRPIHLVAWAVPGPPETQTPVADDDR